MPTSTRNEIRTYMHWQKNIPYNINNQQKNKCLIEEKKKNKLCSLSRDGLKQAQVSKAKLKMDSKAYGKGFFDMNLSSQLLLTKL